MERNEFQIQARIANSLSERWAEIVGLAIISTCTSISLLAWRDPYLGYETDVNSLRYERRLLQMADSARNVSPKCVETEQCQGPRCISKLQYDSDREQGKSKTAVGESQFTCTQLFARLMTALVKSLSILDRLLALFVLLAMILGVVIGVYAPNVQTVFNGAELAGTPIRKFEDS